jgi:hypothetical protein
VTLDFRLAGGSARDASLWWYPHSTQQRAQDTRTGIELSGFTNSDRLGIPQSEARAYTLRKSDYEEAEHNQ